MTLMKNIPMMMSAWMNYLELDMDQSKNAPSVKEKPSLTGLR